MKKTLIVVAIIIVVMILSKEDKIIIPDDAIRFRVIANSNTLDDQRIKNNIAKYVEEYVISLTKDASSSDDARKILLDNKNNIKDKIDNYLVMNNIDMTYDLSIGKNLFPVKNYHGVEYREGYYDSVVLSLGNKQGLNWWCVMYPPLCLIDRTNASEVEVVSLAKELLEKYKK